MTQIISIGRVQRFSGAGVRVVFGSSARAGTALYAGTTDVGIGSLNVGMTSILGVLTGIAKKSGTLHLIQSWGTNSTYMGFNRTFLGTAGAAVGTRRAIPFTFMAYGK